MYKIATPISHLFKNDDDAKLIVANSDCLECRDHSPKNENTDLHELFHFEMQIIHPIDESGFRYMEDIIQSKPKIKLVSFHVASCCDKPVLVDGVFQMGGTEYSYAQLQETATKNIARIRSFVPSDLQICIENNNYLSSPAYKYVIEPGFLNELVSQNNIHFLYDIAHAHISAVNMKIPFEQYYSGLPISKTKQVHICKFRMRSETEAFDAHDAPDDFIYSELKKLLHENDIEYVTVEYYREIDGLINSLEYLQNLKHELS